MKTTLPASELPGRVVDNYSTVLKNLLIFPRSVFVLVTYIILL